MLKRAKRVGKKLLEMDPTDCGVYVLLRNISASVGDWDSEKEYDQKMKESGIKKAPGMTHGWWQGKLHVFVAGEKQPHDHGIDWNLVIAQLQEMKDRLRIAGYVFDLKWITRSDLETDEEKIRTLCHHSEKIAIAFFLVVSPQGTPIELFKNLRVCGDCHEATKRLSKIYGRLIIVQDANRTHHFKDGKCSCNDYY
jgi:hypothetical protein